MVNEKWWIGYPWRNIQTNIREIDMEDIDARQYVKDMKDFNATIAMISVGGIIANYQTRLVDETKSSYLHGSTMASIIDECHKAGIKVIARMDFSKIREDVYQRHPDWAYRTAAGTVINYNGDVHACLCGDYQQKYVYKIVEEVIDTFPIDGMYFNMGGFVERDYSYREYGICHCDNCRRKFKEYFGLDLPSTKSMDDPVYRKYLLFKDKVFSEERQKMYDFIKARNPSIAVDLFDYSRGEANTEYKRPLPFFQYSASSNTRTYRGISSDMVASNCSVDFIGFYLRHVAVSAPQQKLRLYQAMANHGGLDYYLIGRLDNHLDKTGYDAVKTVFGFQKEHEKELAVPVNSIANVLLMKSSIWQVKPEERGWIRALTESHILFDEAQENEFATKGFGKYTTILVPAYEKLSAAVIRKLEDFASEGGTVIVVGESGKYDENYDTADNPFGKLLGITKGIFVRRDMISSMLERSDEEISRFPSLKNTRVLMLGDNYLYAEYAETTEKYLSLIPPHRYGPPERCYFTQVTQMPGVTVNRFGKGKGIFIPWNPGMLYYREGYENTLFFMKDVLRQLAGIPSVAPDLTEMVEVTYGEATNGTFALLCLVNTSGHFGTSYVEPLKITDITITVPCRKRITKVTCLTTGKRLPFRLTGGDITFVVPSLDDFESIKIE